MKAIILAAGEGKRMQSDLQKVMHPILGKPMVRYVVDVAKEAGASAITVVVGKGGDEIEKGLEGCEGLSFAVQKVPLGTGDAVKAGAGSIAPNDDVLVLCGDMPLVTAEFLTEFAAFARSGGGAEAVVAAVYKPDVADFGRVYDDNGDFVEIVEARDITAAHSHTDWANTGIYMFKGESLLSGLARLKNTNSQQEYYLTDVPKLLREEGKRVRVFHSREDLSVFTGINTQVQLAEAVRFMRERINAAHMMAGVRMIDPSSVYIDSAVKISRGAVIYPAVILEGNCEISENAVIGANCQLTDTIVGAGANVKHSVCAGAKIGAGTDVGPFAYLRPGAVIGEKCRVGNFVEVKNATLGNGTKMAHLSYIGDADVGSGVNYSCGAITANYDGKNKFRTKIGDNAFIGSNANLIAPIEIGENGFVAAGSTLTDDLPPRALGIARQRQSIKADWAK
ncbi:MAG: bifunctional UDP-N-acetylglucosamine diphosphorylase/glucosamine-1-phosphate N-acetyltransferase GlmU [Defluviitaleaceae bacterium]|nr:bifunctional UDP-N-acetylglucosamine diphosphorylase/glucosamine-1-phosphate N-acetyltransferase GlmU [Defluviitaleaceae bacterium]MCL2263313.1 bifunctional UDP-N-acetylglucosamine diphosphorylase/glucosamine-1-phosphate N-acetyltransferase GlmU [Defluviitaleaceae bacterium]